jgi:hypothetical protein
MASSVIVSTAGETVTTAYDVAPIATPTPGLWFKMPDDINKLTKKVFAHYFGPYPRSINNAATRATDTYTTAYLNPNGIAAYTAVGGWHRDRPIYRNPLPGDWMYADAVFDIQVAQAAGIDGFFCDMLGLSGSNYDNYVRLVRAASDLNTGFYVIPMVDANGATGAASPSDAARAIATFAGKKSSYHLPDGRFVVSCFRLEGKPVEWWSQTFAALKTLIGKDIAFLSVALNGNTSASYSAITAGESVWGYGADPVTIKAAATNLATGARSRGKLWMAPVETQDIRPAASLFDESGNTEATRSAWERAIAENADFIQHVTWSDFSEGTTIAPSEARGYGPLDLSAWYHVKFKTGEFPQILQDEVILSHRSNLLDSKPTGPQTKFMAQWNRGTARTPARDTVEILSFLTSPAQITATIGGKDTTYDAPAGMFAKLLPLIVGAAPSVKVSRNSSVTAQVASVVPVVSAPLRDDKQYYWFTSARGTAGQRAPYGP